MCQLTSSKVKLLKPISRLIIVWFLSSMRLIWPPIAFSSLLFPRFKLNRQVFDSKALKRSGKPETSSPSPIKEFDSRSKNCKVLLYFRPVARALAVRGPRLLPSSSSLRNVLLLYNILATSTPSSSLISSLLKCKFLRVLL
jgi:hypothetical protein